MTIEEILKLVEEMDEDEFNKLIFSKKFSDNVFNASCEADDKLWTFENEDFDKYLDKYLDGRVTEPYEYLADDRKALIKRYILVIAYYKTISKITDKFEELLESV